MVILGVPVEIFRSNANFFTILTLLAYPIGVCIQNIYFHPLAKYPGRKLWAATYFPYIAALLSGKLVSKQTEMHDEYGEVVRIGPNEISFASEEAWKDIYEFRPGHKEVTKDDTWYIAPNDQPQNIVTTNDPKTHARMRKYLQNSFTEASLRDQRPLIEGYAELFISRLHDMVVAASEHGALVDMTDWINFFTVDVIGDLAFGESFGCLQDSDYHPWVRTLFHFLKGMVFFASTRFYPWVGRFIEAMIPASVLKHQQEHTEFANRKVAARVEKQTTRPDFMTPFLKRDPKFEHMSLGEIQSTFAILLVAGSETPATVMCGIMNHITRYPEKLHKLEAAIRNAFEDEKHVTIETTTNIAYLEAVINEGLRLCNPVPGGLPRIVPEGGDVYAGHYLLGGTKLSIRPYYLSRSKNFTRPHEFIPERWLPVSERPKEFVNDNLTLSKPFSTGPTGCLGTPLAWAEMRLILARLTWKFDLSVDADKAVDWSKLRAMMKVEKGPMPLRLRLRTMA